MELIRGGHNLRPRHGVCAATIGNFDGVHRGHWALLQRLRGAAAERGMPAVVVTFEPHPREYFAPDAAPTRITGLRDKLLALAQAGVDRVLCLGFGPRLAAMEAEDFVREILVTRLGVRLLMVGDDFRFGHGRRGDYQLLSRAAAQHGFALARMPTVMLDSARVSSTRVRQALDAGDLDLAAQLLGRAYRISGRVAHGDRLGRRLGWPTANIRFHRARPALEGIFTVRVRGLDGIRLGVASVGNRPSVAGGRVLLEVHLLDFSGDIYGRHIEVEFLRRLRDQIRFSSREALSAQIARDVAVAREYFRQRVAG
ncbi:MAG: bifunctional riboflavin kinase/FAD synthetase [Nitrococcus sp.]|nr:bifunctional riboflavin kinase/FAD synthetase [Nitrococcus sp.]